MTKIFRALWLSVVVTTLCGIALAQLPVTDDSYVTSAQPTTNNGNSTSLVVQKASNGTALIRIDVSQLTGAGIIPGQVSKAYLKVYATAVTGQGTFDLYKITSSWAEGTVTYNTTPSMTLVTSGTTCPSGTQCIGAASKYFVFDITSLVQGWITAPASNFGLALKPNATTISATLESKESTTTSHAPEVDVVLNASLAQIPGSITESQVTNLTTDLTNLNFSVASKVPQSQVGAANGVAALDNAAHVPLSEIPDLSSLYVDLLTNQTIAGNKKFTGSLDASGATSTSPVKTIAGAPPIGANVCIAGQMVLQTDATPGQQLFVCNATLNGWVMVNDDSATTATANAYTDSKVAAEAAARSSADSAEAAARTQGDADTLSTANTFTTNAVATEAAARTLGDTAAVASANGFTSAAVSAEATARAQGDADTLAASKTYSDTGLALKANLAGGNNFSGDQSVTGNVTVKGTLSLPAAGPGPSPSQPLELSGNDASNQPNLFRWFVNNSGSLDLFTSIGGNPVQASGLLIGPDGKITFASGQTFPGTQNLTAGTGISLVGDAITNTGVLSFNARNGAVSPASGDYSFGQISGSISPDQVSAGTYTIDINGSATSAGTAALAANATNAANSALLSGEAPATAATANTIAARDASGDLFANVFHGSGASLTNIPSSALPGNVAYTDAANVFSQTQTLGPLSNAASQPSNFFRLNAFDGSSASQSAQLQAKADGSLSFQFGPTSGPIAEKLSIDNTGLITFAPGQTFPGTSNGTVTSVNTGAGLTGGPITSTGTISILTGGVTNAMLQNSSIGVIAGSGIGVSGTSSLGGSFTIANTGVLSFNGRNGLVTPLANDYSFAQLSGTDSATSNLVYNNQANTYTAGSKQTFKASATLAGLSFDGGVATDPTTLASGDTWFNTAASHLKFFDGTTTKTLAFTTDIAAGTVTGTGLTSGQLIVGAGGSSIATGNLTGEVTTSGSTAATLAATISSAHTFSNAANAFSGSGAGLSNVNAATLGGLSSSAFAQLGTNNVFTGSVTASSFSGNGANLTALNASSVSTGTMADARLSTNVALLNAANSFTNTTGNTFAGTTTLGNTGAGSGGLLIPPSANGAQKASFPFDMEATNTGNNVHLFRIVAQDGTTPNWNFQFCNSAPCTPTADGLSIAGSTGLITFAPGQTFPGAGTGTVTQVSTGAGLTGGPITTTGTISLANSGVTAGTYTKVTVDATGRVTTGTSASFPDIAGSIVPGQVGAGTYSININGSAGSAAVATTATNASNLLLGTTVAGTTTWNNVGPPATPGAGTTAVYVDSTTKKLCSKDDAGNVNCTGASAGSTAQAIGGGTLIAQTGLPTTGQQDYFMGMFQSGFGTSDAQAGTPMPKTGTLGTLFVKLEAAPGGAGFVYTVDKNGAATTVTCTVAAAATTCSDTTHTVAFNQGDLITVHGNKSGGSTTAQPAHWTAQLQ